jgi:hypothetical protein
MAAGGFGVDARHGAAPGDGHGVASEKNGGSGFSVYKFLSTQFTPWTIHQNIPKIKQNKEKTRRHRFTYFSVYIKPAKETPPNRNKIKWLQLRSARQNQIS